MRIRRRLLAASACAVLGPAAVATPEPPAPARPNRVAELTALVGSFQPADRALPNRWSQAVRSAFLFAGAQIVFAAESGPIAAWSGAPGGGNRHPDDFLLVLTGEQTGAPEAVASEARRFLDLLEARSLLIHLDELAERPCRLLAPPAEQSPNAPLLSQETYELGALRNFASVPIARMCTSAGSNPVRTLAGFAGAMELGRAACGRPVVLGLITGQTIQGRVLARAIALAAGHRLDADACRALLAELDRRRLPRPGVFIDIERVIALDAVDRYYDKHERELRTTDAPEVPVNELSRAEALSAIDDAFDRARAILETALHDGPPAPQPPPVPTPDAAPERDASGIRYTLLRLPAGAIDPDNLLASSMPPLAQVIQSEREHRCLRAGLRAALLLELHRLGPGGGRYPASLDTLAPPEGERWPVDPLDPSRPLGYRAPATTDGPYTLYSVGADGRDDGAAQPARARREALIDHARFAGTDYVIWP